MTDIVERVRGNQPMTSGMEEMAQEAANEIEHLRSRLAVLEGALLKLRELMDE